MSSPVVDLLLATALPAALALPVGAGLWLRRRRQAGGAPRPVGWEGAALALALALGLLLVRGWGGLPPPDVNDWPTLLLVAVGGLAAATTVSGWLFAGLAGIAVGIAAPLILRVPLRDWSVGEALLWLPAYALPWLGLILAARSTALRLPQAALPAWGAALAVSAVVSMLAGSAFTAQHLGGAAAAAGAWAVLRLLLGDAIRPASLAVALAAGAPLWWLLVHTLTDLLPATALLPLAAAPLAAWTAWPLRHRPWTGAIVAAVAAGGIAAIALTLLPPPPPPPSW